MTKYFLLNVVAALAVVGLVWIGHKEPASSEPESHQCCTKEPISNGGEGAQERKSGLNEGKGTTTGWAFQDKGEGKLKRKSELNEDSGTMTEWTYYVDQNGREIKHGQMIQKAVGQFPGKILLEVTYCDGVEHGLTRFWNDRGVITHQMTYDQGVESGLEFDCFDSGKLSSVWFNVGGRYHGPYVHMHESGRPKTIGEYQSGKKHGRWIEWNEAGEITRDETWHYGTQMPR